MTNKASFILKSVLLGLSTMGALGRGHTNRVRGGGDQTVDQQQRQDVQSSFDSTNRNLKKYGGRLSGKDYLKDWRHPPTTGDAPTASPTSEEVAEISTETTFTVTREFTVSPTCGAVEGLEDLRVEVCLLADASSSFADDYPNLVQVADGIFDTITSRTAEARFGVAAFVDYPVGAFGGAGDYPYRLVSAMSLQRSDWITGVADITIRNGGDSPESQYDAIVGATQGLTNAYVDQPDCGWSQEGGQPFTRVLVVTTDNTFHTADGTHENDHDSTVDILNANQVRVVGLEAPGALNELDELAAATGGTVQPLSSDGSDIATAIIGGLETLPCLVSARAMGCEPLTVEFVPSTQVVPPGGTTSVSAIFSTTDAALVGTTVQCQVEFSANGEVLSLVGVTVTVTD